MPEKRLIDQILADTVAYRKIFFRITGTVNATLLLSQMWFWSTRAGRAGWFYKTKDQWYQETGLSKAEQLAARERLRKLGYIKEKERRIENNNSVIWYQVQKSNVTMAIKDEIIVGKRLGREFIRTKPATVVPITRKRKSTPG